MANREYRTVDKQDGAAMVEFSLTLTLFLILVIGIIEFSLVVLDFSRANELTRSLARMAIVTDPVCDIFGTGCPDGQVLACPGPAVTVTLAQVATGCGAADSTACRMLDAAEALLPTIQADQIVVTYACSVAGAAERPRVIPLITVGLRDASYPLMVPALLGLETEIPIPDFETTRTGEDLYTGQVL